ncbi:MAG: 30S ribosomal protein S4 [Candidatus Paceibacterota bacterium]|jgi:small subunit ribosomal protein S4
MLIKQKYKIARRLGPSVFEKTQGAKFALRQERRGKPAYRPRTEYGLAVVEKQRVRYSYGINERQFSRYVKESVAKKGVNSVGALFARLETRLDNTVYRLGFAPTRQAARQMVTHGHIQIDGRRVAVPSYNVSVGEKVSVRNASLAKPLFKDLDERMKKVATPSWLSYDADKKIATVQGLPKWTPSEHAFSLQQVIEFYSR